MTATFLPETPSQTAGPYVHIGLALAAAGNPTRELEIWNELAKPDAPGEHILLTGQVFDGNGNLVRDSFLEVWQANHEGIYDPIYDQSKPFNGFGRTATTFDSGDWTVKTVKPGKVLDSLGRPMAPHINLALFARGINIHLQTRIYFEDEGEANAICPVLNFVEPPRRPTLMAKRFDDNGQVGYRFDIYLQGPQETVFFDF
ncbi:protocatechuate 3,4-dioxygenase alpha subunit [Pseudomonas duriflava]|uniref:Protocatechuate 3,4-dioxygenase alpha subunit n=1 Tax=Pseudomonas duriflava TaxID=459528 RepID=A0A562QQG6_9PSED|nr:protocatechuate 3,4-dioxygenase subunit alpha [Pseudomonas duriflava]TWI58316.1 protocatechuate 3,4-dioxygenase alpha subunit [Pseudomonas duriflava]